MKDYKMKGIQRLAVDLSALCAPFGVSKVRFSGSGQCYYLADNASVRFSFYMDRDFIEHILSTFGILINNQRDYLRFSLLHEIGHHFTLKDFSKEELLNEQKIREMLHYAALHPDTTEHLFEKISIDDMYFAIPSEQVANEWASEQFRTNEAFKIAFEQMFDKFMRRYNKPDSEGE